MIRKHFKNEHFLKYFFNTGWLVGEKVLRIFANAIVGIFVARYLGPSNYGLLNYALSYVAIFIPIAALGLGDIIIREFIKEPEKRNTIFGTALILRLISALLVLIIIFNSIYFSDNDSEIKSLVFIVSFTVVFQSFDIFERFFQSKVKAGVSVRAYVVSLLISSTIKIILVSVSAPLIYFAITQVLEILILALGWLYGFFFILKEKIKLHFSWRYVRILLGESWMLVLSGLMVVLYMRIDQLMIKEILNIKEVGNFTAAVKLSESYYFIPLAITSSLLPAIINGKKMGEDEYKKRLQKLFDLLTWIAIPIALVLSFVATPLTDFLYGSRFENVGPVLSLHVWAGVFVFWGLATSKCFIIEKMPYFILLSTFLGCSINIYLNTFLIREYGIIGAALATVSAQFVSTFLSLLVFKRTRMIFMIIINSFNLPRVYNSLSKA